MRRNPSVSINSTTRFGNIDAESPEKDIGVNNVVDIRTKHFIIGVIVLCLSIFISAHMIISFAIVQPLPSGKIDNNQFEVHNQQQERQSWKVSLKRLHINANKETFIEKSDDNNHTRNHMIKNTGDKNVNSNNSDSSAYNVKFSGNHSMRTIRQNPRYFYDLSSPPSSYPENTLNKSSLYCKSVKTDAGMCIKEPTNKGFRCLPSFLIIGTMKVINRNYELILQPKAVRESTYK
jgi:hypothetical protein